MGSGVGGVTGPVIRQGGFVVDADVQTFESLPKWSAGVQGSDQGEECSGARGGGKIGQNAEIALRMKYGAGGVADGVVRGGGADGERGAGCRDSSGAGPHACLNEILGAGDEDPAGAWSEGGSFGGSGEE